MTASLKDHVTLWMVSQHSVGIGGNKHSGSEDIMFLICQVILQDNVSQEQWDFISRSLSM